MKVILVQAEDLEFGRPCALHLTRDQAQALLEAGVDETLSLGRGGASLRIDQATVLVRGLAAGPCLLSKREVTAQIQAQLED